MKKLPSGLRVLKLAILFVGTTLVLSGVAHAAWLCIHGTNACVQSEGVLARQILSARGMVIDQMSGTFNWVHFQVPSQGNRTKGARYIRVNFWCSDPGGNAWVSDIHVYNGHKKHKEFTGNWGYGSHDLRLDLGKIRLFNRGLGISLKTNVGAEVQRFEFYGACANFVNRPVSATAVLQEAEDGEDLVYPEEHELEYPIDTEYSN